MKKPHSHSDRLLPALVSRSALAVFPILFALAALSLMGCVTDSEKGPNRTLTSGEYNNHDIGLKIVIPPAWESKLDQTFGDTKIDLVLLDTPRNGFRPNLLVIHSAHSGPTLMAEVLPMLKNEIQAQIADVSLYRDSVGSVNSKEVGYAEYETTVNGNPLHYRMMLFVNNGRDVVITLTDGTDDWESNAAVQGMFDGISITPL